MMNSSLGNNADPDNVYVNVRINHDNSTTVTSKAFYDVTKNIPIVKKPNDYYLAVVDFTIPLTSIPLTIAKVKFNDPAFPNNINTMQAQIRIDVPGPFPGPYSEFLIYVPTNTYPAVTQSNPNQQIITPYYYIYSYTALLNMFNTAILNQYTIANDAAHNNGLLGAARASPYFYLDPATQLITLVVSNDFKNNATLSINDAALNYLQGFNMNYIRGNPPALDQDRYQFNFYNEGNNCNNRGGERRYQDVDPLFPINSWFYDQEYSSLDLWSDLRKIFITTDNIPIKTEEKAVNLPNGTQTGQVAYVPVLFDYTPVFDNSSSSRTLSYYVPQSQYRLVDVLGTEPINKLSITVFWQDTLGDAYPLYIQIYQAINLKLGFFKKSVYKNYFPNENNQSKH